MVKNNEQKNVKTPQQLEEENEKLNQLVAELQAQQPQDRDLDKYMAEMRNIEVLGKDTSNTIKVQEFSDHKNISLWVLTGYGIGKRIGPLHPSNARRSFELFWRLGVKTSTKRPTESEIAAYKKTDEYRAAEKAHLEKREVKDRSRKKGNLEKLIKQMAELTGVQAEALTKILSPEQVGKR